MVINTHWCYAIRFTNNIFILLWDTRADFGIIESIIYMQSRENEIKFFFFDWIDAFISNVFVFCALTTFGWFHHRKYPTFGEISFFFACWTNATEREVIEKQFKMHSMKNWKCHWNIFDSVPHCSIFIRFRYTRERCRQMWKIDFFFFNRSKEKRRRQNEKFMNGKLILEVNHNGIETQVLRFSVSCFPHTRQNSHSLALIWRWNLP